MTARSSGSVSFSSFVSTWRKKRTVGLSSSPNSITCTIKREHYKMLRAVHADKGGRWPNRNAHLKYGERETLPLEEVGDQLDQVVEHYAGQVGQLLELVPQAELESHLLQIWGQDYWMWANCQNANKTEAAEDSSSKPAPVYTWKANTLAASAWSSLMGTMAHQCVSWWYGPAAYMKAEIGSVVNPPRPRPTANCLQSHFETNHFWAVRC